MAGMLLLSEAANISPQTAFMGITGLAAGEGGESGTPNPTGARLPGGGPRRYAESDTGGPNSMAFLDLSNQADLDRNGFPTGI